MSAATEPVFVEDDMEVKLLDFIRRLSEADNHLSVISASLKGMESEGDPDGSE